MGVEPITFQTAATDDEKVRLYRNCHGDLLPAVQELFGFDVLRCDDLRLSTWNFLSVLTQIFVTSSSERQRGHVRNVSRVISTSGTLIGVRQFLHGSIIVISCVTSPWLRIVIMDYLLLLTDARELASTVYRCIDDFLKICKQSKSFVNKAN